MNQYQPHPAAEIFPLMRGVEFDALVKDIREHGQRDPIVLHEGMVLDGRNRHAACVEIGVDLVVEKWDANGSAQAFVISKNLHRRHLGEGQRAMIGAKVANIEHGKNQHTIEGVQICISSAARLLNVGERSIYSAKAVLRDGTPEEIAAVEQGNAAVSTTAMKIRERQKVVPSISPDAEDSVRGARVKIPGGTTFEEMVRRGLDLEANGAGTPKAAGTAGLDRHTYRMARYIVLLSDRDDLSADDQQTVATALSYMNEHQQVGRTYETVLPLVERIWGKAHERRGRGDAQSRIKKFDHSFGAIIQSCLAATDVDVPQFNEQRAAEIVCELIRAIECLRILQRKIEELHK